MNKNLLPGPGITIWDDTDNTVIASTVTPIKINSTGDLTAVFNTYDNSYDLFLVDKKTPIITPIPAKPIFIFGFPNSTSPDELENNLHNLERKLTDYHVIVIRNKTNNYTAKTFSGDTIETKSIDEIKDYIKFGKFK